MAESLTWVDADGSTFSLSDGTNGVTWGYGATGRGMPPVLITDEPVPSQDGSRFRSVRFDVKTVTIPLIFTGSSASNLETTLNSWADRFNPLRGNARLRVTDEGGNTRELICRYTDGMPLAEGPETRGPAVNAATSWVKAAVVVRASHPHWVDTSDTTSTTTYSGTTTATFFTFPNSTTGSFITIINNGVVIGAPTINNTGHLDAWPVWTLTGPGTQWIIRNTTTGKLYNLTVTLGAGETVTVDTRPDPLTSYPKMVYKNGVSTDNHFGSLSTDSSLWPLQRGNNVLSFEVASPTVATSVALSFRRRWLMK